MQLDERSRSLFNELMSNPSISGKEMEKKYNLTRRQLGYSFGKINDWLLERNLPKIKRTSQGYFIIDPTVLTQTSNESKIQLTDIYSKSQRIDMILLMLMCSREELSLNHFAIDLDVSRNTILNDLKQARKTLVEYDYDLTIRYSRIKGYVLEGKEFDIRRLLTIVIEKIIKMPNGEDRLKQLAAINDENLAKLRTRIEKVESRLNLRFTDEKLLIMPYTILLVLRRIEQGKRINAFNIHYKELSGTKEYKATEEILFDYTDIPKEERLFITLNLLTSNVTSAEMLTDEMIPNLEQALDDMLHLFEKRACVNLRDRKQLLNKLLLHFTPAYYRIKYELTEVGEAENLISKDYKELHLLVSQSTQPLADLIGSDIPEIETAYLTMLIGGWMRRQGDSIEEKVKAIVVCPKGVSVSRLMLSELRNLFPEFVFLDSLSIREFRHYNLDYDIVFAPTFVKTDKKLFLASTLLGYEEKRQLRRRVMMELSGFAPHELDVEEMLEIVSRYAVIEDEHQLAKKLQDYITPSNKMAVKRHQEKTTASLSELITRDKITLRKSVGSWEEAIRVTSAPLLKDRSITENYVNTMVNNSSDPYIVISPNVAIPHAAPEEGVNRLSMSLLLLENGVQFSKNHTIHVVVVVAAVDKELHIRALTQLFKLVEDTELRSMLIQSQSINDVLILLKSFV